MMAYKEKSTHNTKMIDIKEAGVRALFSSSTSNFPF